MTIEIHEPELEMWIQQRMQTGRFGSIEDLLIEALQSWSKPETALPLGEPKKNFAQFLLESPLPHSGLELERTKDYPRPVEL